MYNLLTDSIIRVRTRKGNAEIISLPGVFSGLVDNSIESFPGLAPHQEHSWHAFLVQLAAIALNCVSNISPPVAPGDWTDLLRKLVPAFPGDEPWSLVVEDLSRPAFMQPPVPENKLEKWAFVSTQEDIDILVIGRNHDVKASRLRQPELDYWLYALINYQTMSGYPGARNYGIIRMNSGYGNRPGVSFSSGIYPGERFVRDLGILIGQRDSIIRDFIWYAPKDGLALLWLEPWDGKKSLPLEGLDPYFIEVCRRVRFQDEEGHLLARTIGSASQRTAGQDLKGNTADPWTPTRIKDAAALCVGSRGFHYGLMQELLFSANFKPGICQRINEGDDEIEFIASAMSRGQGKTEGLHQRRLPLTAKVRSMFCLPEERDRLAEVSERMVEDAGEARRSVLKPSLLCLLQGAPDKLNYQDGRADSWLADFDRRVDAVFFSDLWGAAEIDDADARRLLWARRLAEIGRDILCWAEQSLPVPEGRRYRALATAERIFEGSLRNKFPELKKEGAAV